MLRCNRGLDKVGKGVGLARMIATCCLHFPVPVIMSQVSFMYNVLIGRHSVTYVIKRTKIDITNMFILDRYVGGFLNFSLTWKGVFG